MDNIAKLNTRMDTLEKVIKNVIDGCEAMMEVDTALSGRADIANKRIRVLEEEVKKLQKLINTGETPNRVNEEAATYDPVPKEYIGDGVYIKDDGYGFTLTSENGISVLQTIVIEPEVWAAMQRYVERIGENKANHHD